MNPVERLRGYHDMEWRKKAEEAAYAERMKEKAAKLFAPVVELLAQLYDAGVIIRTSTVPQRDVVVTRLPDPRRQCVKDMNEYNLRVGNATYFLYVEKPTGRSESYDKQPYRMRIGDNGASLAFTTPEELVDFMLKELCGQLAFPEAKKPEAEIADPKWTRGPLDPRGTPGPF